MKKKITIEVEENICSDLADVLCYFAGFNDAKDEGWRSQWIMDSLESIRTLKLEIQKELNNK